MMADRRSFHPPLGATAALLGLLSLLPADWPAAAAAAASGGGRGGEQRQILRLQHEQQQSGARRQNENERHLNHNRRRRPNFIIFQPDDYEHYDQWYPPPHFPDTDTNAYPVPLPNTERLRSSSHSLHMTQAYVASSVCGTSRYATMTGRYPSRSSYSRRESRSDYRSWVTIPQTLLRDVDNVRDGMDCSSSNIAQVLRNNGYATGFVGKWHLSGELANTPYDEMRAIVQRCGFDYAESIYRHNLQEDWVDNTEDRTGVRFSHNMEYVTMRGLEFVERFAGSGTGEEDDTDTQQPFFLYFNPTVPHSHHNVYDSLTDYSCRNGPDGIRLSSDPSIPGMTANYGGSCRDYRDSVLQRARGRRDDATLGSILVDDSIGALLDSLERTGQLDNTFFLFQADHGQEGKWSVYEPGIRIPQFVHYPNGGYGGREFDGIVGTIDIAPTILDYAGIAQNSPGYYDMDGISWKNAVTASSTSSISNYFRNERCIYAELFYDRAVICGRCYKFMDIDRDKSRTAGIGDRYGWRTSSNGYYNLCDNDDNYVTAPADSLEGSLIRDDDSMLGLLQQRMECHLARTDPDRSDISPDYLADCGDKRPQTATPTPAPTAPEPGQNPTGAPFGVTNADAPVLLPASTTTYNEAATLFDFIINITIPADSPDEGRSLQESQRSRVVSYLNNNLEAIISNSLREELLMVTESSDYPYAKPSSVSVTRKNEKVHQLKDGGKRYEATFGGTIMFEQAEDGNSFPPRSAIQHIQTQALSRVGDKLIDVVEMDVPGTRVTSVVTDVLDDTQGEGNITKSDGNRSNTTLVIIVCFAAVGVIILGLFFIRSQRAKKTTPDPNGASANELAIDCLYPEDIGEKELKLQGTEEITDEQQELPPPPPPPPPPNTSASFSSDEKEKKQLSSGSCMPDSVLHYLSCSNLS